MGRTKIEWCDVTWSPVTGCSPVSRGCDNCWARRMAQRLRGRHGYPEEEPFRITLHSDRVDQPSRWRKPRRIFVSSMGDLFHKDVFFGTIDIVMRQILENPQHTFILLTKRPQRALQWNSNTGLRDGYQGLPNLWLGVSVEDQATADKRIPLLLQIPAAKRIVCIEPCLGPVDFGPWLCLAGLACKGQDCPDHRLDWVILGGESGPGARPMHPTWARKVRHQCQAAGVPFFFKQWGEWCAFHQLPAGYSEHPNWPDFKLIAAQRGPDVYEGPARQDPCPMYRVGKKEAGRLLDGCEYNEFPTSTEAQRCQDT